MEVEPVRSLVVNVARVKNLWFAGLAVEAADEKERSGKGAATKADFCQSIERRCQIAPKVVKSTRARSWVVMATRLTFQACLFGLQPGPLDTAVRTYGSADFINVSTSSVSSGVRPRFNLHPLNLTVYVRDSSITHDIVQIALTVHSASALHTCIQHWSSLHLRGRDAPYGRQWVGSSGQGLSRCRLPASCRKIESHGS